MIPPNDSPAGWPRHRSSTLHGLVPLVDGVADPELPRCLLLLAIACADAGGVGSEPAVVDMFTQWRATGRVGQSARVELAGLTDAVDAAASDESADSRLRDAAFRRARAFTAIRFACGGLDLPPEGMRDALRESAYEASFVLNGVEGVGGVLASSAAPH